MTETSIIERVQDAVRKGMVTPGGLASKSGLHRNTLYGCDREGWNPTIDTLRKIEPHLPKAVEP